MCGRNKIACFIIFLFSISFFQTYGQASSWLQRSWQGRAFVLGNEPKENYDLILTIGKIKGKNFEGNLRTIQTSDTAIQFNTKVEGFIYEKHMLINISNWKVKCGNCKPQTLSFSIENGKFYLKGEAKGCSQECTWITVFSRSLIDFDLKTQEELFAAAEEIITGPDTTALAANTEPPVPEKQEEPDVAPRIAIVPAGAVVNTQKDLTTAGQSKPAAKDPALKVDKTAPEKRVPVMAAGDVVTGDKSNPNMGNPKTGFEKSAGLSVNTAVPEKRIPVLPAGAVVMNDGPATVTPGNPKTSFDKNAGLAVNSTAPEKRIPVLPAGAVVVDDTPPGLTPGNPKTAFDKNAGLSINSAVPEKRIPVMAAGAVVMNETPANLTPADPKTRLDKSAGLSVNSAVPEKRIPVMAAGNVVTNDAAPTVAPGNPKATLDKNAGLTINDAIPEKKIPILAPGSVIVGEKNETALVPKQNKVSQNQPTLQVEKVSKVKPPVLKDTASALPEGYSERTKNVVKTIDVNTDSITLRLYDNGVVDGDIVSVIYNDQVVVDKLSLVARPLIIKLPVKRASANKLVFHAHNLGEFPPNTAQLEVIYGGKKEELTIASDYTISSEIDIMYQEKK